MTPTVPLTTRWRVWACSKCSVERSDTRAIKMQVKNWDPPSLSAELKAESATGLKLWLSRFLWFMGKSSLVKTQHSHRNIDACNKSLWVKGMERVWVGFIWAVYMSLFRIYYEVCKPYFILSFVFVWFSFLLQRAPELFVIPALHAVFSHNCL